MENKTPVDEYDQTHGTYKDPVESMTTDEKLPLKQMPQAPDPAPFKFGQ